VKVSWAYSNGKWPIREEAFGNKSGAEGIEKKAPANRGFTGWPPENPVSGERPFHFMREAQQTARSLWDFVNFLHKYAKNSD
jgi:hypothetical protein